jgi:hypothetical protein
MLASELFKTTINLRDYAFIYERSGPYFPVVLVSFNLNGRSWLCDITYLHITHHGVVTDILNVTESQLLQLAQPLCDAIEGVHQLKVVTRGEAFIEAAEVIEKRKKQQGEYY